MQLSEAIDGWLAAHAAGLSMSTRRDILDIGASAERCGYSWMDCVDVREHHMAEIVTDADLHSSLNASAIGQFLEIAVEWAITEDEAARAAGGRGTMPGLLPSDTDGWLDAAASPVVDDLTLGEDSWVDELPPVDDLDVDNDGELDPVDDDQFFDVDDVADATATDTDLQAAEEPADATEGSAEEVAGDELIDEDDLDDDELAAIDDDLTTTDEDELDDDELDHIDGDLDALIEQLDVDDDDDAADGDLLDADLFDGDDDFFGEDATASPERPTSSAFATAAASGNPDPAATSFLRTLEQTGQTPAVFGGLASSADREPADNVVDLTPASPISPGESGIFSEAAQYEGERRVDWITVAYFAVAAICFGFVIYLALTN